MADNHPPFRLQDNIHPVLYEVNTRVLLAELSRASGKTITLGTIPDELIDRWEDLGFDAVWLMGVWTTGEAGRELALSSPGLEEEYRKALPDFTVDDVAGSPYAVSAYEVSPLLGGPKELARLRKKLAARGIGLILDFVVNHTALDHLWVKAHPEYYVQGTPALLDAEPGAWFAAQTKTGEHVLAHGRDPMFPPWTDTAQINHAHLGARTAMIGTLRTIAEQCDGVRSDMAMLVLRDVFQRCWGDRATPAEGDQAQGEFWTDAIAAVREFAPRFVFIAEAYWDLEWPLQLLGFDYTYDKKLYDKMRHEGSWSVEDHLRAELAYQLRSVRFIENHDEPRAAAVFTPEPWHYASAVLMATVPGMVLIHDGQMEGRTKRLPVQLSRRCEEPVSRQVQKLYENLLAALSEPIMKKGDWQLLEIGPAWHDNHTWEDFLAWSWNGEDGSVRFVVINYAPHSSQCYVSVPLAKSQGPPLEFRDLISDASYVRDRAGLASKGVYFDLPAYGFHIFAVTQVRRPR